MTRALPPAKIAATMLPTMPDPTPGVGLPFPARRPGAVRTIALAQLFGTSLWFSANSAAADLMRVWHLGASDIGWLVGAVQTGFILGTLAIALGGVADGFRASRIFVAASLAGAFFNACFAWWSDGLVSALALRFMVGVSLAGIYPMGMKLIVGWAPERTGAALSQLVAMLTLGTALPHALRRLGGDLPWQHVMLASSVLAIVGAVLVGALGDGPHAAAAVRSQGGAPRPRRATLAIFRIARFRASALGYFGHMWELYAFWALVPLLVSHTSLAQRHAWVGVPGLSFAIIGIGALGSWAGGRLSQRIGSERVACGALAASLACAVAFAGFWRHLPADAMLVLMLLWGATVIADSAHFSALSARACPPDQVGSALALQNAIGFALTVVSIAATTALFGHLGPDAVWLLVPGPVLGLLGYAHASRTARRGG